MATSPPNTNTGANAPPLQPENPEMNPKTLAASFTTLLALGGLLFAIGTGALGTFVHNRAHKTLIWFVGFSLGSIFYGLVFLSAKLKYRLYIWLALSVTWIMFWFSVNENIHPKKYFIKMVLIINSILAALIVFKTLFLVGVSESLRFLKKSLSFWGSRGFLYHLERANPWLAYCLGFASPAVPAPPAAAAAAPPGGGGQAVHAPASPAAAVAAPPGGGGQAVHAPAPPAAAIAAPPRGGGQAGHAPAPPAAAAAIAAPPPGLV